jgi:tRNA threonylcarbamoyl adenosine modification protein YjeE
MEDTVKITFFENIREATVPTRKTSVAKLTSAKDVRSWAKQLADTLQPGESVVLMGSSDSSKTLLTEAIVAAWGDEVEIISSRKTVKKYATPKGPIYHLDLSLLTRQECLRFDLKKYFDKTALCLIEGAERIQSRLPRDVLEIYLRCLGGERREVTWTRRK